MRSRILETGRKSQVASHKQNDDKPIPRPLALIILDGWGVSKETEGNAIALGKTPNMDQLISKYPHTFLEASGEAVGLPMGQMGNSEVGHLNLGAGRIVYQEFTRITKAIDDGSFFTNPALLKAIENARVHSAALHLLGLLSDGGVHSHNTHLYALLDLAKRHHLGKVYLHLFLDGRDVPPQSALIYIDELEKKIKGIGLGQIATMCGRYYAMDRDKRWDRTKLAYQAMVYGMGEYAQSAREAVENSYALGVVDEFVKPTVIKSQVASRKSQAETSDFRHPSSDGIIKNDDSIIFFNFRSDRTRQITRSFIEDNFSEFDRGVHPPKAYFVCMTEYDATFKVPIAFPPMKLKNILADVLEARNMKQLHIAETEKYAHVTFFFNGGEEEPKKGEERRLIPSPKVATYDLKPEMSAHQVTDTVIGEIEKDIFEVIILNYANPDMVGHTGILEAAIKAIETVDDCVGKVVQKIQEKNGVCFITADHGNAEKMIGHETGGAYTAHTTDLVPFIYISGQGNIRLRPGGCLADVAPTVLEVLGIAKPAEMSGESLIVTT